MDVMIENKVAPNLRFKEFKEVWTEKKIGELFEIKAGGDLSKNKLSKHKTNHFKHPVFSNSEKNKGLFGYTDLFRFETNCITVTGRGKLGIAHARLESFYPIVRLLVLKPKEDFDVYFGENIINRINFFIESTGVPQLTAPQISLYKIVFPSLIEQQKIASFLSTVDKKLQQLTKKKELLKEYEKGIIQKIFSQELCFKDDNGNNFPDWEEKKFTELLKLFSSSQVKNSEMLIEGKYPVIEQGKKESLNYSNDENKLIKNECVIVYGDHTTVIKFIDFNFVAGPSVKLLKALNKSDLKYLYYNLCYNNIKPEGYKRHFSILKKIYLQLPNLEEQKKIANFLSAVDNKIDLVSTQIENTKAFKKGLLQQMFV